MSTLLILIGLPASGKTTYAHQIKDHYARVSRDVIRAQMFGIEGKVVLEFEKESAVTNVQRGIVLSFLNAGRDVVLDDTNLRSKYVREWVELAHKNGHKVDFKVFEVDVPTLIKRNDLRALNDAVPEKAIATLAAKFTKAGKPNIDPWKIYDEVQRGRFVPELYYPDVSKPKAILVDLDGTLALNNAGRSFYDWGKVYDDDVNENVLSLVHSLSDEFKIIFMSGRDERARGETVRWLYDKADFFTEEIITPFSKWSLAAELHMRPQGDQRPDSVVKAELFDEHVRDNYNVVAVFDDRNSVVDMWRSMGLTVCQVNYGDF